MLLVKELFYKTEGRQVRHFIVAFAEYEDVDLEHIYDLAQKIALYCPASWSFDAASAPVCTMPSNKAEATAADKIFLALINDTPLFS